MKSNDSAALPLYAAGPPKSAIVASGASFNLFGQVRNFTIVCYSLYFLYKFMCANKQFSMFLTETAALIDSKETKKNPVVPVDWKAPSFSFSLSFSLAFSLNCSACLPAFLRFFF